MTSTNPPVDPPVDPVALRAAFGAFMTGVTVVTTHNSPGAPVDDRFEGVNWHAGPHGAPIIDDVSGWFDCRMHDQVQAGDHLIMIGEVKAFGATEERALGYARSGYFRLDV
jgi:flavin reductase (DIM6/NTAB) family NADH-FMN oxidoreductase RutF